MITANALSHHSNHSTGIEDDNANMVAIPTYLFILLIDLDLQHAISDGYTVDIYAQHVMNFPDIYPSAPYLNPTM